MTITAEQLAERKNYLGSSDIPAILGMSQWATPLSVWAEKTGQVIPEDISGKMHIKFGNKMEPVIAEIFEEETGKKLHRVKQTIYHPNYSFLAANLDFRVVGEDAVAEVKNVSAFRGKEFDDGNLPAEVIIQTQFQMAVTGKSKGYAIAGIGGNTLRWQLLERDNDFIKDIVFRAADFWTSFVEPKVMPQTVTAGDSETLLALFPDADEGAAVNLGVMADELADNIKKMQAEAVELDDLIEQSKNKLRLMLGANAAGVTDRYKVTWRPQTTERLDLARFKQEKPEIYKAYLKESSNRVLRVSPIKNKTEKESPANV